MLPLCPAFTYLDLIQARGVAFCVLLHLLEMVHPVVTDTNSLAQALLLELLQCSPQLFPSFQSGAGRVNQVAINVPQS